MPRSTRFNVIFLPLAIFGILLLHEAWAASRQVAPIPYSEFQRLLREKKVEEVVVVGNRVEGQLKPHEGEKSRFVATRVEPELARELEQHGVKYGARAEDTVVPTFRC